MILVCGHPGADVRRTVAKHNATTGFVVAQVANGVSIGEHQIREVQHHDGVETHRKNGCVKKFEDLGEAGATSLDAAAFSGIANWLAVL